MENEQTSSDRDQVRSEQCSQDEKGGAMKVLFDRYARHPEQTGDEYFLKNTFSHNPPCEWSTARFGKVAYDVHGKAVKEFRPVFVSIEEYSERNGNEIPPFDFRRKEQKNEKLVNKEVQDD